MDIYIYYVYIYYVYIYYGLLPYNVINHDISYIHHNYIMLYSLPPPGTHPSVPLRQQKNRAAAALVIARFSADLVDAQGAEAAVVHEPIEVLNRSPPREPRGVEPWVFAMEKNGDRKRKSHRTPCLNMFVKS